MTGGKNSMTCPLGIRVLVRNAAGRVGTIKGVGDDKAEDDREALIEHRNDLVEGKLARHHRRLVQLGRDCRRRPWRYLNWTVGPRGLNRLTLVSKRASRGYHRCTRRWIRARRSRNRV